MRKVCFFISLCLTFTLFFVSSVKASENISIPENHKDGIANFSLPKREELDKVYGWESDVYLFTLDLSNEQIKNLCSSKQLYVVIDNTIKYPLNFLSNETSSVKIGLSYGINDKGTAASLRLRTNVAGYNTILNYRLGDDGFPSFESKISHTLTLCCEDASINLNDFVISSDITIDEYNNFDFTGYRIFPGLSQGQINGYGFDVTIGFNIPCNYPGLDGVILGRSKNSLLEKQIVDKIKDSSVLTFNGKKLNIPKNKISVHFYEPTNYSTDELKQQYGYYDLSDKGPYDLYKDNNHRLRGRIIISTGNVPQDSDKVELVYSSDFVDKCLEKPFSLKGYEFSSTTYSCSSVIDFVKVTDENGDGFDDVTGQAVGTKYDENGNHTVAGQTVEDEPNRSDYDDGILGLVEYIGDLIVYWIKAPFVSIANGFTVMINSANSCFEWFSNFGDFFNNFFNFLPAPIQTCAFAIIGATTVSIILAMFFKR